jgi:pyruvate dehydrogenase E1 component
MFFEEFKRQLPDIDPAETEEWLASLDQLVEQEGEARARFLTFKLL